MKNYLKNLCSGLFLFTFCVNSIIKMFLFDTDLIQILTEKYEIMVISSHWRWQNYPVQGNKTRQTLLWPISIKIVWQSRHHCCSLPMTITAFHIFVKLRQGSGKDRQGMALKSGVGCDVSIDMFWYGQNNKSYLLSLKTIVASSWSPG